MKGIILARGIGSRLYPLTMVTSKQFLPLYNKSTICCPFSNSILAGINDISIISNTDLPKMEALLEKGDAR